MDPHTIAESFFAVQLPITLVQPSNHSSSCAGHPVRLDWFSFLSSVNMTVDQSNYESMIICAAKSSRASLCLFSKYGAFLSFLYFRYSQPVRTCCTRRTLSFNFRRLLISVVERLSRTVSARYDGRPFLRNVLFGRRPTGSRADSALRRKLEIVEWWRFRSLQISRIGMVCSLWARIVAFSIKKWKCVCGMLETLRNAV